MPKEGASSRETIACVLSIICLTTACSFALGFRGAVLYAQSPATPHAVSSPAGSFGDREIAQCNRDYCAAIGRRNIQQLENAVLKYHQACLLAVGSGHPDERSSEDDLRLVEQLKRISPSDLEVYWQAKSNSQTICDGLEALRGSTMPDAQRAVELFQQLRKSHEFFRGFKIDRKGAMECDLLLINACVMCRKWDDAHRRAVQFLGTWSVQYPEGGTMVSVVTFLDAIFLAELSMDVPQQMERMRSYIAFVDRYARPGRFAYWHDRGLTGLAEICFQSGNRTEADRLFDEVRSRLPETIDNEVAGWCKSWCDRHAARQFMEQGDWDGAYRMIVQAQAGMIDYGRRDFNKGLTLERMLRLSAEIQRKRGNDKEAEADLRFAERIAENAARLREALEPEFRLLHADAAKTPATRSVPAESTGH